jgi:uncharacterized glyoxalase superfamily protein PhnB
MHLRVEYVDAAVKRAVAAGAKLTMAAKDQFYGERSGRVEDPFGHRWLTSTHIEDVSPHQMQRRFDAMAGECAGATTQTERASSAAQFTGTRPGFNSITPYITLVRAEEFLEFTKQACGAVETFRTVGSAGGMQAEVRIGDSMLMMGGFTNMCQFRKF